MGILTARQAFVGEPIPDMAEEITPLGFSLEEFLIAFGREGEVTVDFTAVKAEVQEPAWRKVSRTGQQLGFQRLPIQIQLFGLIPDCATIWKLWARLLCGDRGVMPPPSHAGLPETDSTATGPQSG